MGRDLSRGKTVVDVHCKELRAGAKVVCWQKIKQKRVRGGGEGNTNLVMVCP